ncbi:MAG: hypothetical protein MH204_08020 [Fimbriimonadaceae bacterium]|nr:hypothetical protein [Fimbriimonadaceae bacterium]
MLQSFPLTSGWTVRRADRNPIRNGNRMAMPEIAATVPGHVHVDLMAAGILADPFHRMQEMGAAWVDDADWLYALDFDRHELPGGRLLLRFDGLDTVGEIRLNGELLAEFDNMFVPLEFDVKDRLADKNRLEVLFRAVEKVGQARREAYFERHGLPETTENFEPRTFVRKAQYMFGWDWGPVLLSCGIWKPVSLIAFDARLTNLRIDQSMHEGRVRRAQARFTTS